MVSIPVMRVAKPSRIAPVSRRLSSRKAIYSTMPMTARMGVKEEGFSSRMSTLPPSSPARLSSQGVTVVPMLAPMITWTACRRVMSPELTKPTTITVAAEELWITAVTPRPVSSPAARPVVSRPKMSRRPSPARRSRACPIRSMPNRNRASPPAMLKS